MLLKKHKAEKKAKNIYSKATTNNTDWNPDRHTDTTHTFTHYYDRNGSRKVCQEYQTNVLSEGNRSGAIAVFGLRGHGNESNRTHPESDISSYSHRGLRAPQDQTPG